MQQRWWVWIAAFLTTLGMCAVFACSNGLRPERAPPGSATPSRVGVPVLVAKIDNSPQARPPVGLGAADVVYVEPVEGGLSRLAAVFSTDKPPVIGPVRSVRETDLTLLDQFGNPTLASSGAAPSWLPLSIARRSRMPRPIGNLRRTTATTSATLRTICSSARISCP